MYVVERLLQSALADRIEIRDRRSRTASTQVMTQHWWSMAWNGTDLLCADD